MKRALLVLSLLLAALVTPDAQTRLRFAVIESTPVDPNPQPLITSPTNGPTYNTSASVITVSGTCDDNIACTSVTYACAGVTMCSDTATGTASWSFQVTLAEGATTITVTAHDASANTAIDALIVTYTADDETAPVVTISGGGTFNASSSPFTMTGNSTDAVGVVAPTTWSNTTMGVGGSCTAGTGVNASFSCAVALQSSANSVTIQACDQAANCGTDSATVVLTITLSIDQTTMPGGNSGSAYSRQLTASGGTGSKTWSNNGAGTTVNDGDADCSGITISSGGLVSGTHTGTGTCSFTAKVVDSANPTPNEDTQALAIIFSAGGTETSHQYFDTICALPEVFDCWSLRDNQFTELGGNERGWFHYYTGVGMDVDTYDDPQDAMKISWDQPFVKLLGPSGDNNILFFPINQTSGTFLIGWDEWLGKEWRYTSCGGMIQTSQALEHKQFQFGFDENGDGTGKITLEIRQDHSDAPDCSYAALLDYRIYAGRPVGSSNLPLAGIADDAPFAGTAGGAGAGTVATRSVGQKHSTWTRRVCEIRLNQPHTAFTSWNTANSVTVSATPAPGTYHMWSCWVGDEATDMQRHVYQAPVYRMNSWLFTGRVTFTGTAGTLIPQGTVVTNGSQSFTTRAACTISATVVAGNSNCASAGGNTARVMLDPTAGGELHKLDLGEEVTLDTPIMGVNDTATAFEDFNPVIRNGLSSFWFEGDTSTSNDTATGTITFTGTDGVTIPGNTKIQRVSDGHRYVTFGGNFQISGGSVTVPARSVGDQYGGPAGNMDAGVAMTFTETPIVNVTGVESATAFTGGAYVNAGDLVSYMRNVWILKDYTLPATPEDDTTIFKKPVR